MSYILDALRRADSERERGTVPTLHANPVPADQTGDDRPAPRTGPWARGAGALGLLLLGGGATYWLLGDRPAPGPAAVVAQAAVPAAAPAPAPAPQAGPQQPAPAPAPMPTQAVAAPPAPVLVPIDAPAPVKPAPPPVLQTPAPRVEAPPPAAPRVPAPPAERPAPPLAELPEDIRKQLPAVVPGGAMYSDTPAARMLILNGQVFHEGDQVAPQLVLEQIKLRGAVLSFKGQRYSISY